MNIAQAGVRLHPVARERAHYPLFRFPMHAEKPLEPIQGPPGPQLKATTEYHQHRRTVGLKKQQPGLACQQRKVHLDHHSWLSEGTRRALSAC